MPLTELIIDGFKSFADKTTIHFNDGITAIVGPNGSGKSNITEALRWVMGESRAKTLRGDNMKDIIFAGSQFRKPLNRAEVTLIFDNKKRELRFDDDRVSVTRRLLRSGDSEYLINKRLVRLRDIKELFMDSGISQNSLAIISQGRVDQILNSKPEERKALFEEAAGVLHFKAQKEAAESQLAKTNDNLIRINDLVKELENQIGPLQEQSSLAKEYQFQKKGLDQALKTLLGLELQFLNQQKTELKNQSVKSQQLLAKLDNEVKQSQAVVQEKREVYQEITNQRDLLQQKLVQVSQRVSDLTAQIQVAKQSKQFDLATQAEYQNQISDLTKQIISLTAEIKEIKGKEQVVDKEIRSLQEQKAKILKQLKDDPEKLNQLLDDERNNYIQLLQDQTSNNNQIVYLKSELKRANEEKQSQDNNVGVQLAQATNQLEQLKQSGKALKEEAEKLQITFEEVKAKKATSDQKARQIQQLVLQQRGKIQRLTARKEALNNIQKRHEGYYYGVRNILNHLSDYHGVVGAVGELLTFPENLEAAMITALGSSVQNLITDTKENAKNAINLLKRNNAGRATFLPLDGIRQYEIPSSTVNVLKTYPGFIGIANELVANKGKIDIKPAINYLLGTVVIVDSIETAVQVSQKVNRYRIVTLEGDVISPGGSMTGGVRNERNSSPLQTTSEINKLTQAIAKYQEQLQIDSESLNEIESQGKRLVEQIAQLTAQLQDKHQALNSVMVSYQAQQKEVNRLESVNKLYTSRIEQQKAEVAKLTDEIAQLTKEQNNFEDKITAQKAKINDLQLRINDFAKMNQELQSKVNDLEPKIAVSENKLENLRDQRKDKQRQLAMQDKQLKLIKAKFVDLSNSSQASSDKQEQLEQNLVTLEAEKKATGQQLTELAVKMGQANAQINKLDQVASRNYDLRKDAAVEQEELSVKLAKITSQMNQHLNTLSEDYSLTYEAVIKQITVENTEEERDRLKRSIKLHRMSIEDIGPVNLNAIEEYESVKQRYDFLKGQQDDLVTARENLKQSMSELDDEVNRRFSDTFEKIATSFSKIFPKVFGGGSAKLLLTEPENLMTTGIEIIAEPPGKKLQRLSLLSGGERALTAITLLFAMLNINPVPFCVLDEVEAALDDANIDRFGKFLKKYDLETQFIVITHRRGTMEQASQLFGVVMQESGVSQILSVNLKDIDEEVE